MPETAPSITAPAPDAPAAPKPAPKLETSSADAAMDAAFDALQSGKDKHQAGEVFGKVMAASKVDMGAKPSSDPAPEPKAKEEPADDADPDAEEQPADGEDGDGEDRASDKKDAPKRLDDEKAKSALKRLGFNLDDPEVAKVLEGLPEREFKSLLHNVNKRIADQDRLGRENEQLKKRLDSLGKVPAGIAGDDDEQAGDEDADKPKLPALPASKDVEQVWKGLSEYGPEFQAVRGAVEHTAMAASAKLYQEVVRPMQAAVQEMAREVMEMHFQAALADVKRQLPNVNWDSDENLVKLYNEAATILSRDKYDVRKNNFRHAVQKAVSSAFGKDAQLAERVKLAQGQRRTLNGSPDIQGRSARTAPPTSVEDAQDAAFDALMSGKSADEAQRVFTQRVGRR